MLLFLLLCALYLLCFPCVGTARDDPEAAQTHPDPLPYAETNSEIIKRHFDEAEAKIAQGKGGIDDYRQAGLAAQQLCVRHKTQYLDKAVAYLTEVIERDPGDSVMRAYLGSVYAMRARDSSNPLRKLTDVRKGISLLNQAVEESPRVFIVRMLRGSVFFDLPSIFRDDRAAMDDFRFAANRAAISFTVPDDMQAEILYKLGVLAGRAGDADFQAQCFNKAMEAAPKTRWAILAAAALAK